MSIDVSNRCNARCRTCAAWLETQEPAYISPVSFRRILSNIQGLSGLELDLIGAEPTLHPDLAELVAHSAEAGFRPRLFSNGFLITRELARRLVEAGLRQVTISLDGGRARTHDRLRGMPGSFDRAIAAVGHLAGEGAQRGLEVAVATVVSRSNFEELREVDEVARAAGAHRSSFHWVSQVPADLAGDPELSHQYAGRGQSRLLRAAEMPAFHLAARRALGSNPSPSLAFLATLGEEALTRGRFPIHRCRFVRNHLNLDVTGEAYPCSHFKPVSLGSVAQAGWQQVWSSAARRTFLRGMRAGLAETCAWCCHHQHNLSLFQIVDTLGLLAASRSRRRQVAAAPVAEVTEARPEAASTNGSTRRRPGPAHDRQPASDDALTASVVIPTRGGGEGTLASLDALRDQEYPGWWEVIVVEDGSRNISPSQQRHYPEVRFLHQEHCGPAAARNLGAAQAKGEIVVFIDDDCLPEPGWLREMLRPFADPVVVGVKGAYASRQPAAVAQFVQAEYEEKYARLLRRRYVDFVDTYSAAFRRDLYIQVGGLDASFPLPSVEDRELSLRLSREGRKMAFNPKAVVFHSHVSNLTAYLEKKFKYGRWGIRILRSMPKEFVGDDHTPHSQRLQAGLVALLPLVVIVSFWLGKWWLLAAWAAVFWGTSMPLLSRALTKGRRVALVAVPAVLFRALGLVSGLGWGALVGIVGDRQERSGGCP